MLERERTIQHTNKLLTVWGQWLMPLITEKSTFTKRALMKCKENYPGPCAYKDVGKVVSSIVKEQTTVGLANGKSKSAHSFEGKMERPTQPRQFEKLFEGKKGHGYLKG